MKHFNRFSLKTKCILFMMPLVVVSLFLLANTTNYYWSLQERIEDFKTDIQQVKVAGSFATSASRQITETLQIVFAKEDAAQFHIARLAARKSLLVWKDLVRGEADSHTGLELADLLEIERLYQAPQRVMQEIIELARHGDYELSKKKVISNLDLLADRKLFDKATKRLHSDSDDLGTTLHEIVSAIGQLRFIGQESLKRLREIELDYRQTVLASRFLVSLNRQVTEYTSYLLKGGDTYKIKFVQWEANQTLNDWRTSTIEELVASELNTMEIMEDQFVCLISQGDKIIRLMAQGHTEKAWEFLDGEIQELVDTHMIPLVSEKLEAEEIELSQDMARLSEYAGSMMSTVAVIAVLIILLGIATPWVVARYIVRPIIFLTEATETVGAGDFDGRVKVSSHDKIGRLAHTFNIMADHVQESHEVLEQRVRDRTAQLQTVLDSAEAATIAKSAFLANMSHEIRTPLTAILGFAENLIDINHSEEEKLRAMHTIRRNGKSLLGIINDILDISKIEAGKFEANWNLCEPCKIIAEVHSLIQVQADARGLPLHIEYLGAIPETIHTDSTRLRQILINLIGNAIKFTKTGSVRLVTRLVNDSQNGRAENAKDPHLQFDVIDTGQGMTAQESAKLFEPFIQADSSRTRRVDGTGLGLTISKRFAILLGGDLNVLETAVGVGSSFRVTVATGSLDGVKMIEDPLSATIMPEVVVTLEKATRSDLQAIRILLAEDSADLKWLISLFLKNRGADVSVQENGKYAMDAALAARDSGKPFDVILMDMQMPIMDGYEATTLLRQQGYTAPIIAMTAHAMEGEREACIKIGCDDYISKPLDRKKLIELILNLCKSQSVEV